MISTFEFATASRILFGRGALHQAGAIARSFGDRALVVTGRSVERAEPLVALLKRERMTAELFLVEGEPTVDRVREGVVAALNGRCNLVIGFGGGSPLDAGKAIAALATNPGDPLDYLEVIGAGKPLTVPSLPFVAIPTTAGTGSEVTRNAVLGVAEQQVKISLRSPHMLPALALVDPLLTVSCPPEVTARSGMDALTQLIEPFVSPKANPITDALCGDGIRLCAEALEAAYHDGENTEAREKMALASLYGGMALSNARLGAVHGFAGPLGGMYGAPHGALCARLLPAVMEANVSALRAREPDNPALDRYDDVGRLLSGEPAADAAIDYARDIAARLGIPPLSRWGITASDISTIVPRAKAASSMQGNPIKLTDEELESLLTSAL